MEPNAHTPFRRESLKPDSSKQLQRDRKRNDQRLKGTFEHIFAKYSKDFTNVGDEIDLETGRIVVNNGHVASMQHERDVDGSASRRLARAFTEELGDGFMTDGLGGLAYDDDTDEDELSPLRRVPVSSNRPRTTGSTTSSGREDGNTADLEESEPDHRDDDSSSTSGDDQETPNQKATALTQGILSAVPTIRNSLTDATKSSLSQSQTYTIDPVAINALGQNIANQIASFLTQHVNPIPRPQATSQWAAPALPQDFNDASPRPLHSPSPYDASPALNSPTAGQSLWAISKHQNRPGRSKRRKLNPLSREFGAPGRDPQTGQFARRRDPPHATFTYERPDNIHEKVLNSVEDSELGYAPQLSDTDTDNNVHNIGVELRGGVPPSESRYFCRFSEEEDERIRFLRDVNNLSWREIVAQFPGRSLPSLSKRYHRLVKDAPIPQYPHIKREIVEIDDEDEVRAANAASSYNMLPVPSGHTQSPHHLNWARPNCTDLRNAHTPNLPSHENGIHQAGSRTGAPQSYRPSYPPPPGTDTDDRESMRIQTGPYPANRSRQQSDIGRSDFENPEAADTRYPVSTVTEPYEDGTGLTRLPNPASTEHDQIHPQPKEHRRYRTFDTTQGTGTFGLLRSDKPMRKAQLRRFAAQPQDRALGPITASTGTFGVLKAGKPKNAGSDRHNAQSNGNIYAGTMSVQSSLPGFDAANPIEFARDDSQETLSAENDNHDSTISGLGIYDDCALPNDIDLGNDTNTAFDDDSTTPVPDDHTFLPPSDAETRPAQHESPLFVTPPPEAIDPLLRESTTFTESSPLPTPPLELSAVSNDDIDSSGKEAKDDSTRKPIINRQVTPARSLAKRPAALSKSAKKSSSLRASALRKSMATPVRRMKSPQKVTSSTSVRARPVPAAADGSDDELA